MTYLLAESTDSNASRILAQSAAPSAESSCASVHSALRHHLDQVPRAQFVSEIPAPAKHYDFPIEMPSLEQIQRSHPGSLSPSIPIASEFAPEPDFVAK